MAAIRYLSLFLWAAVLAAGFDLYAVKGLPHAIVQYTFVDNGRPYDLSADRHYLTCTFYGPYGAFTVPAMNGKCAWVRFFKRQS